MGALHVEEIPSDTKQSENEARHLFLTFKGKNAHTHTQEEILHN